MATKKTKRNKKKLPKEAAPETPKVGVGIVITRSIKGARHVLMGVRRGAHSAGDWAFPGGHFDFGELTQETVLRELAEECGPNLKCGNPQLWRVSNVRAFLGEGKHYLDLVFHADWFSGRPKNMEPEKCEGWFWVPLSKAPEPMSPFSRGTFQALQDGTFFDPKVFRVINEC